MNERKENLNYEIKNKNSLRDMLLNEHNSDETISFGTLGTILMNYNKKNNIA